ncbi:RING finger protein 37 [Microplitis demolitor]|uniref:RING finger protein 37 n=1 Tax=Microplitis demolitor TaxID=69319 RepID=UPI0004CCF818|nr:RING finger protein 37 [Microplitis demolitor]
MLINLCNNYLNTKVKCDKPSCDDYDVDNLLAVNDKGFLVYSCIKPPINIDFNFVNNIKLNHIIIWPAIGEQKSTGFKLTVNSRINCPNQLAVGFLNPSDSGIIFCCNYVDVNELKNTYSNFSIKYISSYSHKFVTCMDNLKLTIIKTQKSVAAVKRIEIWGHVSPGTKIHDLWINYSNNCRKNISLQVNHCVIEKAEEAQSSKKNSLEIPEEFMDPITCSLMIQPIILPCGKIIDYSTLENYGKNEALWGRQLSDPFTGVRLSNDFRPIYAQALKCRIDKFITDNHYHSEFNNVPRLLGPHRQSSTDVDLKSISGDASDRLETPKINLLPKNNDLQVKNIKSSHRIPIIANYSKASYFVSKARVRRPNKLKGLANNSSLINKDLNSVENTESSESVLSLDDNLRDSLKSLFSNLKNFDQVKDTTNPGDNLVCECCRNNNIKDNCRYKLPCGHIICRSALLSSKNDNLFSCNGCNVSCKTNDIVKVHLS